MAFAGNLTYKALFAIFPFFTFLLSLLGLFNADRLVNTMLNKLSGVLPPGAFGFIENQLLTIAKSQAESAFTLAAIISILLALWGISGAFRSVMEAMNVMYEVEEDRPSWKQYGISIFISLAVILDRKSTRLNSSHANISYAVFCLKKTHLVTAALLM